MALKTHALGTATGHLRFCLGNPQRLISQAGTRTTRRSFAITAPEMLPTMAPIMAHRSDAATAAFDLSELLKSGGQAPDLMACTPEVEAQVTSLLNNTAENASAEKALELGDGEWEVFYMPHIRKIAGPLGLKVQPLRYTIRNTGTELQTDVRMGRGSLSMWLSSTGTVKAEEKDSVKLNMSEFWISSPGDKPRLASERDDTASLDVIINWLSRAAFIEDASRFPVLFFDDEAGICIFRFPPLNSNIAAVRVSRPVSATPAAEV